MNFEKLKEKISIYVLPNEKIIIENLIALDKIESNEEFDFFMNYLEESNNKLDKFFLILINFILANFFKEDLNYQAIIPYLEGIETKGNFLDNQKKFKKNFIIFDFLGIKNIKNDKKFFNNDFFKTFNNSIFVNELNIKYFLEVNIDEELKKYFKNIKNNFKYLNKIKSIEEIKKVLIKIQLIDICEFNYIYSVIFNILEQELKMKINNEINELENIVKLNNFN